MTRGQTDKDLMLILPGTLLVSLTLLALEVVMVRISSLLFTYHYSFLVVSLALLGLGLGGVVARTTHPKPAPREAFAKLSMICSLFSISVIFSITVTALSSYRGLLTYSGLMFLPFFIAGFYYASIYRSSQTHPGAIYFADLLGAGIGSFLALALLNLFAATSTVYIIASISSFGALAYAIASKSRKVMGAVVVLLVLDLAFLTPYASSKYTKELPVGTDQNKELYALLSNSQLGARVVHSRWSSFGRTDLVEFEEYPHQKVIFVDGGSGTAMYHFDADFNGSNSPSMMLRYSTAYFPFYFGRKDRVLIIGPGGGGDVLIALMSGAGEVVGVEVNPDVVSLVREHSEFNGGVYTRYDNVHIYVDEGRSFLKRSSAKYDLIMLNQPVTKTMEGVGGYSLVENYLFTVESFRDYIDHLEESGRLVIVTHNRLEVYKLAVTAITALRVEGKETREAARQIAVIEGGGDHSPPVFILSKTSFEEEESRNMQSKALELDLTAVYLPDTVSDDQVLNAILNGDVTPTTLASRFPADIYPPTDDRPFFYKFERGIPYPLFTLLVGLAASCSFVAILSAAALKNHRKDSNPSYISYYFPLLGTGFALIEVTLFQKTLFFLGNPTSALPIVLSSLMISGAIGSLSSVRFRDGLLNRSSQVSLVISILLVAYTLLLPTIFDAALRLDTAVRVAIAVALLSPLGYLMGMPFPLGIKALGKASENAVSWAWGLNGFFSVFGSVLAVSTAMLLGYNSALLLGALAYFMIFAMDRLKSN